MKNKHSTCKYNAQHFFRTQGGTWSGSEEVDCLIDWCLKPVLAVFSYIVAVKK